MSNLIYIHDPDGQCWMAVAKNARFFDLVKRYGLLNALSIFKQLRRLKR